MNLTDAQQRAIYKWLPKHRCENCGGLGTVEFAELWIECPACKGTGFSLPPLDMNTAFSECIPKLLPSTLVWFNGRRWYLAEHVDTSVQAPREPRSDADFYAALLQYLGVQ
jgi:hypothetical protein